MSLDHSSQSTLYTRLFSEEDFFAVHYYERIRRAFLARCKNPETADDLTQRFFETKVLEGKLLDKFRDQLEKTDARGAADRKPNESAPSFRKYLYFCIGTFYIDHYRKARRECRPNVDLQEFDNLVADDAKDLDPDALYALSVLHRAIQSVRNHFQRKNKRHHWEIFESLVLAEFLTGRKPLSLEELRRTHFPDATDNQKIHNSLTTVKRVFQEVLGAYFESASDEPATQEELFLEWMSILKRSNASLHSALQAAYRTSDMPAADASMAASMIMVQEASAPIDTEPDGNLEVEMAILLSFRIDMPLVEWIDPDRLMSILPRKSARTSQNLAGEIRRLSMASLIEPNAEEAEILERLPIVDLLSHVKDESKRLLKCQNQELPRQIHTLFYTLAALVALDRFGAKITSLDQASIDSNVRWYLAQPWIDDRARRFFRDYLKRHPATR